MKRNALMICVCAWAMMWRDMFGYFEKRDNKKIRGSMKGDIWTLRKRMNTSKYNRKNK